MSRTELVPSPSEAILRATFAGKTLREMPVPSAILDLAVVRRNCKLMLDAVADLQISFRAHVKTHKTCQLTRLQVGEDCKDVRLVVSTIMEAESLLDDLRNFQSKGAKVNVLYGVPLGSSQVGRLAAVAQQLGRGSVSAMIDHVAQLPSARQFKAETGFPIRVFIKTDTGYHRAGISPYSTTMQELVRQVLEFESEGVLELIGFYSHNSLAYGGNSPDEAMDNLKQEIDFCRIASQHLVASPPRSAPLVISVGASPTALAIQNLQASSSSSTSAAVALRESLDLVKSPGFDLEVHAGVYAVFDLQQVAASSRSFPSSVAAHDTIALSILAEVVSLYPDRTSNPEALITTGCLALAREPCKDYPGWGVVTSWNMPATYTGQDAVDASQRMIVKRISQEHGVLGWEDDKKSDTLPLEYAQKLRIWPNHACITSAGFGWYLIVDSSSENAEKVIDIWTKWRGW